MRLLNQKSRFVTIAVTFMHLGQNVAVASSKGFVAPPAAMIIIRQSAAILTARVILKFEIFFQLKRHNVRAA